MRLRRYDGSFSAVGSSSGSPLVRFIGSDDMQQNLQMFQVWLKTLPEWTEKSTPFLFLHTPDIGNVHELVHILWPGLQHAFPQIGDEPSIPGQESLF